MLADATAKLAEMKKAVKNLSEVTEKAANAGDAQAVAVVTKMKLWKQWLNLENRLMNLK